MDCEYQCSSDSSDFSNDETMKTKSIKKESLVVGLNSKSNLRLPTRRPDPNVFNRNALMARENRRKKKEYVEMLERDIEKERKINKKLHKIIKQQAEHVQTLKNEKNYFKSILMNKTEILGLVNLLRTSTAALKPESSQVKEHQHEQINNNNNSSSLSSNSSPLQQSDAYLFPDEYENGSVVNNNNDPFLSILDNSDDIYFTDYNLPSNESSNEWEEFLNDATIDGMFETTNNENVNVNDSTVNDEHSYFSLTTQTATSKSSSNDESKDEMDAGVCLHISGGKFSLEFCAACHENSKKPITEF